MKLASFEGLGAIPKEILQQGTKNIAANMRVVCVADFIKHNRDRTAIK